MNDNKSLNNKYQSFEAEELVIDEPSKPKKPKKEKVKKEKKVKEPKPPKEKKVKEPKPPKEKKVKEPKPPKEKKEKKPLFPKKEKNNEPETALEVQPEVTETPAVEEKRRTEEIVLPVIKSVTKISTFEEEPKKEKKKPKEKKPKEPKPPKEKKVKELKPPKEKKVKEPKPPKEKKEKKIKEKKPREPLTIKDILTIAIAVVALAMIAVVVGFKYAPADEPNIDSGEPTTVSNEDKLSDIQIVRDGISQNIVQSDIPDVFYGFTSDYKLQYYQYHDSKMTAVKSTGSLTTSVDMGNEEIPVTIEYVQMADKIFGIGLFRADQHQDVYFYNLMVFKLVNLPTGYNQEGKALLLATENSDALNKGDVLWSESFVVDLQTGKTERFLKIINRTIDMSGAGVDDFCILTKAGYNSTSGKIPFITSRTYGLDSGKQDIFIKNGAKEELLVSDVYGKFLLTDGNDVIYMKKTNTGFDIMRRSGETETIVKSCYGAMSTDYLIAENYILNKDDGKLYNLLTGEEKLIVGYRMSAEEIEISPDGKYLVMMGTVKNMLDYQIHVFNLETGDYAKYVDKNYSAHSNLAFINNTTAVYVVVDPNQGYECVVLDVAKAV